MSFTKDVTVTFFSRIAMFIIGIFNSILIARFLGPEGKGVITIVFLLPSMIAAIGSLGIGAAHIYFMGQRRFSKIDIVKNSLALSAILGIIYLSLSFLFFPLLKNYFLKDVNLLYAIFALGTLPLFLLEYHLESDLRGLGMFQRYNIAKVSGSLSRLLLLVFLLVFINLMIWGAIFATFFSLLIANAIAIVAVIKNTGVGFGLNYRLLKESLKYGLKEHIGNVVHSLNLRLDVFIIASFVGLKGVGLYSVAVAMGELVWYVPDSIGVVLFPKISGASSNKDASDFVAKVNRHVIFIVSFACLGLFLLGKTIIWIMYGKDFLPAFSALALLLPGILFLTIAKILTKYTSGIGKPQYGTYASFIAFFVNVPLLLILVPKIAIEGAAIATSIAYFIFALVISLFFIKESKINLHKILIMRPQDFKFFKYFVLRILKKIYSH